MARRGPIAPRWPLHLSPPNTCSMLYASSASQVGRSASCPPLDNCHNKPWKYNSDSDNFAGYFIKGLRIYLARNGSVERFGLTASCAEAVFPDGIKSPDDSVFQRAPVEIDADVAANECQKVDGVWALLTDHGHRQVSRLCCCALAVGTAWPALACQTLPASHWQGVSTRRLICFAPPAPAVKFIRRHIADPVPCVCVVR